jgi:phosphohistidine swiveling domain-containing protein
MPALWLPLDAIRPSDKAIVGDKAAALARAAAGGLKILRGMVVTTLAYERFAAARGLRPRILAELERKDTREMRWEEMWDAALRIRNLFLHTPLPAALRDELAGAVREVLGERAAVVVRSSAPGEDGAKTSFAGLHESYVNVVGSEAVVEHVRLVWASLWSDAAILYRRELGLDPALSTMAVVIQEIARGERSGVAFSQSPTDPSRAVVEAVHGLNQGLVDGTVEPDHWELDRDGGSVLSRRAAVRLEMVACGPEGVRLVSLPETHRHRPPLLEPEVERVWHLAHAAETLFGPPQDLEWTWRGDELLTLQSRPVTTLGGADNEDGRGAYLSLTRSLDNLKRLRAYVEDEAIPAMQAEAKAMKAVDPQALDDHTLRTEAERRRAAHDAWVDVYTREFVPLAHGTRLFAQAYNDAVRPDDPFEFVAALQAQPLASLRRNRALEKLAERLREQRSLEGSRDFAAAIDGFLAEHHVAGWLGGEPADVRAVVERLVHTLAFRPASVTGAGAGGELPGGKRPSSAAASAEALAAAFLDLGRASYRLRDDDNLYLGAIGAQVVAAEQELRRRGLVAPDEPIRLKEPSLPPATVPAAPKASDTAAGAEPEADARAAAGAPQARLHARQIVGQPAGPGLATGRARVVRASADLRTFQAGEVLVCDSIEPGMTIVVPLAAAIVERRGGMLVHGAIIAREYGLPCVTGVPAATTAIATGETITVDGYLGIVIVG